MALTYDALDVAAPESVAPWGSTDDALWRRLLRLPPQQRGVVVFRYYEDLTNPEIADVIGC